ncbi:MAG: biotin carboxylase [Planctomycetes bacterium]|nr:biotin carboxylase [Planctomycetota bacterium]
MIQRVLVANRGEIACRVIRTLRALGKDACAVYSDVDSEAPHVKLADDARLIGAAPASESYLNIAKVITAAREMGCDAVHPGYGFLSESASFAEACVAEGLVFIGPTPEAIRRMGDKAEARRVAAEAGVPPVPGSAGSCDDAALAHEAERIGYPLLVKAAMGGGGKGMRKVGRESELASAIASARREAQSAFGDGALLLERYVCPSRHVEVQILADMHGHVVPVLERECSLQRRHQKVIEECPSLAVDDALRSRISEAAVTLAKAVGYVGAGTVELLLEEDGSFWFLEMNTRLQVEHGVTEMVTGQDLVEWQVAIAEGARLAEALPAAFTPNGWAVEARVYAEDPESGFLPQVGHVDRLALPGGPGVRIDCGVVEGQDVTRHYDPMLMKVVAHGSNREEARTRLVAALRDLHIIGPATNISYLIEILQGEAFARGDTFTDTLESSALPDPPDEIPDAVLALAALSLTSRGPKGASDDLERDRWSPYDRLGDFRIVPTEGGS